MELSQVMRERGDLSNQLSVLARKKEGLNDELTRVRQRLEQANETNARINRNLEDLVKDCEEKQVSQILFIYFLTSWLTKDVNKIKSSYVCYFAVFKKICL